MRNPHIKKMIAPVLITLLIVLYYAAFAILVSFIEMTLPAKLLLIGLPLVFAGVCIFMLAERIKEIRSGEEDDLSQY